MAIPSLFEDLEYERALSQIHLARQVPRGTEEEVTLSLYEGIMQCELGEQEQGLAAFKSALLLRTDAKLPVQVSPKVDKLFESVRQQVEEEIARREVGREKAEAAAQALAPGQPAALAPTGISDQPWRRDLRGYSLVPAIAGGGLAVAGGVAWGLSRGELSRLRKDDPAFATMEDVQRGSSLGRTRQTVGVSLLSLSAVSLAAAAGMYVLGAPDEPLAVGVSTNGTAALIHGRWL